MKETDGGKKQEHQKENKIIEEKTDDGEEKEIKTWSTRYVSSLGTLKYDFLSDVAQCQANVVMFQGTQN